MTRKTVHIMRGIPGSGKSTYARNLIAGKEDASVICSADHFFDELGHFDGRLLGAAHNQCYDKFRAALNNPKIQTIIIDNTNTTVSECNRYVNDSKAAGAIAEIVSIWCDPKVAASRNIHGVPPQKVQLMADRMAKAVLPDSWFCVSVYQ